MGRLLFICSQNKLRSPTAETIFADHPGVQVDSAGLNNDAIVPLSNEQIRWADTIIVMEKVHRTRLNRKFRNSLSGKRIAVLGIPDNFGYMGEELIRLRHPDPRGNWMTLDRESILGSSALLTGEKFAHSPAL